MSDNDSKIGCWGIVGALLVLGLIINGVKTCNRSIRKHQEVVFKKNSVFYRTDDKSELTLEFWGEDFGELYNMYTSDGQNISNIPYVFFKIKNGDELFDKEDNYFGYIKVLDDGSFKIKDSDMFNGHFVSRFGDKARIK